MAFDVSPPRDCGACPRLAQFRSANRAAHPEWSNAPVASLGEPTARLMIVGLAPGLRGANRTGRPFTGDYAGDLLYEALLEFGFATGRYDRRPDDGLELDRTSSTTNLRSSSKLRGSKSTRTVRHSECSNEMTVARPQRADFAGSTDSGGLPTG